MPHHRPHHKHQHEHHGSPRQEPPPQHKAPLVPYHQQRHHPQDQIHQKNGSHSKSPHFRGENQMLGSPCQVHTPGKEKSDYGSSQFPRAFEKALMRAKQQWFIIGVVLAILLAKSAPWVGQKGGPLKPEITIKLAVATIFLTIGLSLKTRKLRDTLFQWRIHVTVQMFSLLFTPLVVCSAANGLIHLAMNLLEEESDDRKSALALLEGVKVLSCMPPPVSSAVILTKAVGGNEAAAVFNSTLGSFLGVMVTPLMLLQITGVPAEVPMMEMMQGLGMQIVFPIFLGQMLRTVLTNPDQLIKRFSISKISSGILILIIYTVFCETFSGTFGIEVEYLLACIILLLVSMAFLITLVYGISSTIFPTLTRSDLVTIIFCATQKSLTLGMPLLRILFGGNPDVIAVISIPLLIYHPMQIVFGSLLVAPMQRWLIEQDPTNKGLEKLDKVGQKATVAL